MQLSRSHEFGRHFGDTAIDPSKCQKEGQIEHGIQSGGVVKTILRGAVAGMDADSQNSFSPCFTGIALNDTLLRFRGCV